MKRVWLCFLMIVSIAEIPATSCTAGPPRRLGKFWHVTDFHYDPTYLTSQLSCEQAVTSPSSLGNQWCDSPWTLVTKAIAAMASIEADVDFLLWTGDTVAHISNDKLTLKINMDIMENTTDALRNAFPGKDVLATFGNHDYYPASQFPAAGNAIYNQTADMWAEWIGEEEQLSNFRKGGYYTRLLPSPASSTLRMLALNTNLYYTSDKLTPGMSDPAGQLSWMRTVLQAAKDNGEKVILAAHIPPGVHTPRGVQWFQTQFHQSFNKVIKDFADVIKAMHFGHDHHDGFKVVGNNRGEPGVPLFVAPSVTPWRFKREESIGTGAPHHPALRLVTYDRDTGLTVDIHQYRMDLTAALAAGQGDFNLLYSFRRHYKVPDISAVSLAEVVTQMINGPQRDSLLNDYYNFSQAGARDGACGDECRTSIRCGFRHLTLEEFHACIETDNSGGASSQASRVLSPQAVTLCLVLLSLLAVPSLQRSAALPL